MRWWCVLVFAVALHADDWTQFRGPNGAGTSPSKNIPERFDSRTLMWKTVLPAGHSSPVFTPDHIFVSAVEGKTLLTICLVRATVRGLWRVPRPRGRGEA